MSVDVVKILDDSRILVENVHYDERCKIKELILTLDNGEESKVFYEICKCPRHLPNRSSEYNEAVREGVFPEHHKSIRGIEKHGLHCTSRVRINMEMGTRVFISRKVCSCGNAVGNFSR